MRQTWDALIAGAGPAGAVAAYLLARSGRRVLLVDDVRSDARKVGESLIGAARPLLRDLELLSLVDRGPHLTCPGNVSVWGSSSPVATDFISDPYGPGWHLDRPRFDADLRAAAVDSGVILRSGRVDGVTSRDDGWQVKLGDETTAARWLIDATGRGAFISRSLGARRLRDDSLVALCAWVSAGTSDLDKRTLVESVADGWWYTARLPDRTRVVALHLDAEDASSILHTRGAFEANLERTVHLHRLVADASFIDCPRGAEACGARLDRFAGENWLAVGDAALSFDPLSSQGIFNALYTGMKAGQAVDAALSGERNVLESYSARLDSIRAAYIDHHLLFYQSERRWRDRPFWTKRQRLQTQPCE